MNPFFILLFFLLGIVPSFSNDPYSIQHAIVSIYAMQADTGRVLIDKNSDLSLIPSSCMKIATTGAALHLLGPENRFETHLEYDGGIDTVKKLHGNLYIRGGGDPCLGSDRISGSLSWKQQIEVWADAIQQLGIKRISGKVIGDASRWEKALAAASWSWEDLGNYYGAGACALSFHENYYTLFFKPGAQVGEHAILLKTEPVFAVSALKNEVMTGPKGSGDQAWIFGSEFSPVQFARGTVPAGIDEFSIKGAIPDPAAFCAELLVKELRKKGIAIENKEVLSQGKRIAFHTTYSPTIAEIVRLTNQKSVNLYAEHLLKKMGEKICGEGSTTAGIKAVTDFWKGQKIDLEGFYMADGSGLSRKNLVTTKQLVEMLAVLKKSGSFPLFFASLPQKDGCTGKTGSISLIRAYAGYMGNTCFAIIINQCPNHQKMNDTIELILLKLKAESI